ncbi:uracil-DNA glycosylase [bacterium (Candidatus Blackallbacteria) CG17_big_fil_post_rev_8_21_14_2_50_48_46]|uniref:Uracil-DNA glycosylase n=1 Tax=bacterium (Candidatus Blackallbacteria) CG17_big_fil_post_rev_8_21_14_2_50_48_46 TaxID=2014261 RepID=A0A2M7G375_9BACT|nr:MAG: uracil-DNA glycosylase [bacterium (Candidatus Blackallbacteria) CG18_big_fil_WC_8_21_14_2_50_49_26]PIW16274.1 MAG: uracil-DNA glycosylase [bacterium (Candidatus Blackallbacteria) CG17_big_fil_post_rev_8_21_14_2_50_48_46]PIW49948.1 MAG: uracil-DNA glycosylase [bacterium (Candidatus Blackallbacteria) CG13_big_fil_rev_8_21_14_2_50_49_14]
MEQELPSDWREKLNACFAEPWWQSLSSFVEKAYASQTVYPPRPNLFHALHATPYNRVRVVILGQDPYPGANQAHGLSFSVQKGIAIPRSLKNIYKELESDLGIPPAAQGHLEAWAQQGVLLLNTILTVQAGQSLSHRNQGWEKFTDQILTALDARPEPLAFVLWGNPSRAKKKLLQNPQHLILESAHPSPLSARHGFFGSRPFSNINQWLKTQHLAEIDWNPLR